MIRKAADEAACFIYRIRIALDTGRRKSDYVTLAKISWGENGLFGMNRSIRTYAFLTLAVAFALTAGCKGKGGGGTPVPSAATVKGSFLKDVHTISVGPWIPGHFDSGISSWRTQHLSSGTSGTTQIYGSGYITAIGFKVDTAVLSSITCTGVTVKMGHTSLGVLTTTFTNNYGQSRGSVITVLNDRVVTIPTVTAGEYFMIDLDRPFHYNGVERLVVDFIRAGACTGSVALRYDDTVPPNQALYSSSVLSSPSGTLSYPPNMRFHFSGGDDTVEFGGSSGASAPFTTTPTRIQLLYAANEINGSGPITGVGFQVDQLTTEQTYSYRILMGHTTLPALSGGYSSNFNAGPVATVAAGAFTLPANVPAGSYIWIPLTGTFSFNGQDRLLVDIDVTAGTGDTVLRYGIGAPSAGRRVFGASGALTGATDDWAYHTRFRFKGGTMDVLTPRGMFGADTFPFATDWGKRQFLYRAAELGTRGEITAISCRNTPLDSIVADNMDLAIVLSHTTATVLGTDFNANLPAPVTVLTGTFATPATARGDWVEMLFTTPFTYNGTDNLVVEFKGTGFGLKAPSCALDLTSTGRYPARRAWSLDPDATAADEVNAYLMDLRFTIQ